MPANICSTFTVAVNETLNNSSVTIGNVRSFRVVAMTVYGTPGSTVTLTNSTTGNTAAMGVSDVFPQIAQLTTANLDFLATDNLVLTESAGANSEWIVITCQAITPQALTVT